MLPSNYSESCVFILLNYVGAVVVLSKLSKTVSEANNAPIDVPIITSNTSFIVNFSSIDFIILFNCFNYCVNIKILIPLPSILKILT